MIATPFPQDSYAEKLSAMRLILTISLLAIWVALRSGPLTVIAGLSLAVLFLNTTYSVVGLIRSKGHRVLPTSAHWVDLGSYATLMFLDYSSRHLFLLGILFAIVVGASKGNLRSGLRVTAVSVGLVTAITAAAPLMGAKLAISDVLALTLTPVVMGLMFSYWGDRGKLLERRLQLLREISQIANPRFGVDQTVEKILQKLQVFYRAESCLLVMTDASSGKDSLHRVNCHLPSAALGKSIDKGLAKVFLSWPDDYACIWRNNRRSERGGGTVTIYDIGGQIVRADGLQFSEELITTLEADDFISVPILCYAKALGRLYILNPEVRVSGQEIAFLNQVLENVMRVLENIRLVDSLATEAAHHERQKIARDIHDSIVQPYIGIQIGLSALKRKIESGGDATRDIGRLIKITEAEIGDLRTYMKGLRGSRALEANFVQAVRRLALKFAAASGIEVEVTTDENLLINDRLAAEAFQIIAEGLSNIRRHTQSTRASIHVKCVADEFIILINNDEDQFRTAAPFLPQSISERTAALGGRILVQPGQSGMTALSITIPL